jgi:hypothetical protein
MYDDNKLEEKAPTFKIDMFQKKAPDCRACIFYWNNRGGWCEITEYENGAEKHFKRFSTFKHGCTQFKITVPSDRLPSHFIYNSIGKHCPVVLNTGKKEKLDNTKSIEYICEEHNVDILA